MIHHEQPERLSDVVLADRSIQSYVDEIILPLSIIALVRLLLYWIDVPSLAEWLVDAGFLFLLPLLVRHRHAWKLSQFMILGMFAGLGIGAWSALLAAINAWEFLVVFQFIIQPVLHATFGALAGGFLFVFVFPIIKKLKKLRHRHFHTSYESRQSPTHKQHR